MDRESRGATTLCEQCAGEGQLGPFGEPWSAYVAEPIRDLHGVAPRTCTACAGHGRVEEYVGPLAPTASTRPLPRSGYPMLDELRAAFGILRDDDASQIRRSA